VTVTDNRTGRSYEVPITHGTIRASDLRQIKVDPKEFGMMKLRPRVQQPRPHASAGSPTSMEMRASCDYRGYPIEDLAEKSTYLRNRIPAPARRAAHFRAVEGLVLPHHRTTPSFTRGIKKFLDGFHYDAHPMGMMISTIAALSTFPTMRRTSSARNRARRQTYRLIGRCLRCGVFLPALAGHAVCLSRQRAELPGEIS